MKTLQADAVIIGGGLQGLSTALHLARDGHRAVVLEKDYPGRHASGVNAGGVRRLGRDLSEVPLSVAAMALWHDIRALVDDDCGFVACGQVKVAENGEEMAGFARRVQTLQRLGFEHEVLIDAATLREIVPAVAPHCVGAVWVHDDGAAEPFRTVTAFRRRAQALGVHIEIGALARRIESVGSGWQVRTDELVVDAPVVVNTAGGWAPEIAARFDEPVPIQADALTLMITERTGAFLKPVLGAAGRALSFKQTASDTILIGGGERGHADPSRNLAEVRPESLRASARTVTTLFPQLKGVQIVRTWAGIEAMAADGIPVIGPSLTAPGLFHAFGFSGHGFQLSPIVGRIMADLIVHGETSLPIAPFRINRFNQPGAAAS
jgi:sarcosine oxidase subunit beta